VERYVRLEDGTWRYDAVIGTASSLALESVPVTLPLSEVYRKTGVLATS
jgi:hypothetical protein